MCTLCVKLQILFQPFIHYIFNVDKFNLQLSKLADDAALPNAAAQLKFSFKIHMVAEVCVTYIELHIRFRLLLLEYHCC